MDSIALKKLAGINRLPVLESSCSNGECEYVLIDATSSHRQALLDSWFTEDELSDENVFDSDDSVIDVSVLAFEFAGATWFDSRTGFSI